MLDPNARTPESVIQEIHRSIASCTECAAFVGGFKKPKPMDRGDAGRIMIIGEGPGQTEVESERAFSGMSGKTLDKWLVACGASANNPRAGIYFTAVIKCCGDKRQFEKMAKQCRGFLHRQITALTPKLIITLGAAAYEHLRVVEHAYPDALCNLYRSEEHLLMTRVDSHYWHMPWPHPSGLNRWHNTPGNRERLAASFPVVRAVIAQI